MIRQLNAIRAVNYHLIQALLELKPIAHEFNIPAFTIIELGLIQREIDKKVNDAMTDLDERD